MSQLRRASYLLGAARGGMNRCGPSPTFGLTPSYALPSAEIPVDAVVACDPDWIILVGAGGRGGDFARP